MRVVTIELIMQKKACGQKEFMTHSG
jgi:hypothetical protein